MGKEKQVTHSNTQPESFSLSERKANFSYLIKQASGKATHQ